MPAGIVDWKQHMETDTQAAVTVSTDGSALANPNGPMGWAWAEHSSGSASPASSTGSSSDCGGASNGTNQIGELCAVLQALRTHQGEYPLLIETDSQYAINCSTTWVAGWKKNGWKNSRHEPVKNSELIRAIDAEITNRRGPVKFKWVKGHAGNPYNEKVDGLARGYAEKCRTGNADGYRPYEGWQSLISSEYGSGIHMPEDAAQVSDTGSAAPDTRFPADNAGTSSAESTSIKGASPISTEDSELLVREIIDSFAAATQQFNAAAERLKDSYERMDSAAAKLDETIRRIDDGTWDNGRQNTLF